MGNKGGAQREGRKMKEIYVGYVGNEYAKITDDRDSLPPDATGTFTVSLADEVIPSFVAETRTRFAVVDVEVA